MFFLFQSLLHIYKMCGLPSAEKGSQTTLGSALFALSRDEGRHGRCEGRSG